MTTKFIFSALSVLYFSNAFSMYNDQQRIDLADAIKKDDIEGIEKIIGDSDINQQFLPGFTPLMYALYNGANNVALYLIDKKNVDLNYEVRELGVTPLGFALYSDKVSTNVVKSLIRRSRVDNVAKTEDGVPLPAMVFLFSPVSEEIRKFLFAHLIKLYDKQLLAVALAQFSQLKEKHYKYAVINSLIQRGAYIDPKLPEIARELGYSAKFIELLEFYLSISQKVYEAVPEMPDVLVALIADYSRNVEVGEFYLIDIQSVITKFQRNLSNSLSNLANKSKEHCVIQ